MSQSQDSARARRTEKRRRESSSSSGFTKLTRNISQSFRNRINPRQLNDTTATMPPKKSTNNPSSTPNGEGLPPTNGHSSKRSSNSTNRQSSNAPSVDQPEAGLGPLGQKLRVASEQLSSIQKAIKTITESCIQHADDITQIPEFREKYENVRKESEDKDTKIANLQIAFDFLEQRASDKDQAATKYAEANLAERQRLEEDKVKFDERKRAAVEELAKKKSDLEDEAAKTLSQQKAKQEEKFIAQKEALEIDLEKQKNDLQKKLEDLEERSKKDLQKINKLNGQIGKLGAELNDEVRKHKDTDKAMEGYKRDIDQLEEQLEGLQKEFSLNSKPLEYYQGEFLNISRAIQDISVRYLARDLSKEEFARLPAAISATDSTFSDVPFSDTEASKQLRIAHAQRIITDAIYKIVWQPFSSDITAADPKLSEFLQDVGTAVGRGRSADVWRAVTMRALESMSATNMQIQHNSPRALSTANKITNRKERLVEFVLSVLRPLLDSADLLQFEEDLLQIAKHAISIWTSAQADEGTFTVNPKLNKLNKRDWAVALMDYVSLSTNGGNQAVVPTRQSATGVFTLFPIITVTKRIQVQKVGHGTPSSWPDQDQQQLLDAEVTLVHGGLGLPQESDIVQDGIAEMEDFRRMRLEHEESWDQKLAQIMAEKGHSRNNSTAGTTSGPSSPSASWSVNKLNNHKTGS